MADTIYDLALVLWSTVKIVATSPILLIFVLIGIGKRVVRK